MPKRYLRLAFLNMGHAYDHLFMLLYATVVLALEDAFGMTYGELIALSFPGFVAFAVGALPAGWLGDRWNRIHLMALFFLGIGGASILTGLAQTPWQIAAGLTLIGLFASIYHPVGIAMVVEGREKVGKVLGINGVFGNLGVAGAAVVAGLLTQYISWRAAFVIPGAVAVATGIVYVALVRDEQESSIRAASLEHSGKSGAPFLEGVAHPYGRIAFRWSDLQRHDRGPTQGVRRTFGRIGHDDAGCRLVGVRRFRYRRVRTNRRWISHRSFSD